jgi:hypothetical protein
MGGEIASVSSIQQYLHDATLLDGKDQVENSAGIIKKSDPRNSAFG